jgi:hypothetical protein
MNVFSLDWLLFLILLSLLLSLLLGMLVVWVWAIGRIWKGRPLLSQVSTIPLRPAPWGSMTVFSVIVLYLMVNVAVGRFYVAATGRHLGRAFQPADATQGAGGNEARKKEKQNDGRQPEQARTDGPHKTVENRNALKNEKLDDDGEMTQTDLFLQLALINSILVALVPALVRLTSGASLADFGLSLENLKEQVTVGAGAALLMTPPVLAIQSLAVRVWHSQKHPVEQMVLDRFSPGIAILAVISTII